MSGPLSPFLRGVLCSYPIGQLLARTRERLREESVGASWQPVFDVLARMAALACDRAVIERLPASSVGSSLARVRELWPAIDERGVPPPARVLPILSLAEIVLEEIAASVTPSPVPVRDHLIAEVREIRARAKRALAASSPSIAVDATNAVWMLTQVLEALGVQDEAEVQR